MLICTCSPYHVTGVTIECRGGCQSANLWNNNWHPVSKKTIFVVSGCGTAGRVATSDMKGFFFKSQLQQTIPLLNNLIGYSDVMVLFIISLRRPVKPAWLYLWCWFIFCSFSVKALLRIIRISYQGESFPHPLTEISPCLHWTFLHSS